MNFIFLQQIFSVIHKISLLNRDIGILFYFFKQSETLFAPGDGQLPFCKCFWQFMDRFNNFARLECGQFIRAFECGCFTVDFTGNCKFLRFDITRGTETDDEFAVFSAGFDRSILNDILQVADAVENRHFIAVFADIVGIFCRIREDELYSSGKTVFMQSLLHR